MTTKEQDIEIELAEKRRTGYTKKEREAIIKKRKKAIDDRWDFFQPYPVVYKVVEYK